MVSKEFWYVGERSGPENSFGIYLTVPGFYGRDLGVAIQVGAIESKEGIFWVIAPGRQMCLLYKLGSYYF